MSNAGDLFVIVTMDHLAPRDVRHSGVLVHLGVAVDDAETRVARGSVAQA
jgi:hypothetical protein